MGDGAVGRNPVSSDLTYWHLGVDGAEVTASHSFQDGLRHAIDGHARGPSDVLRCPIDVLQPRRWWSSAIAVSLQLRIDHCGGLGHADWRAERSLAVCPSDCLCLCLGVVAPGLLKQQNGLIQLLSFVRLLAHGEVRFRTGFFRAGTRLARKVWNVGS